ncbi:PH domain-containing protein [Salininema proteolyticum]|uniref:PH domain-containing protein n=1 Tax=Salininema proteolyticum TaxID=1607685 RepID=A0ABV8U4Q6_9ACTN
MGSSTVLEEKPMKTAPILFEYRPLKARVGAWATAAVLFLTFGGLSFTFGATTAGGGAVTTADHLGMWGLGAVAAFVVLIFTRPRVRVTDRGIEVRNLGSPTFLPWEVVEGLSFPKGVPWATLELADDDEISLMAVQTTDKARALEATKRLRTLLEEHKQR